MGPCPHKYLERIVILCFERRYLQQNSVIRLKSNILVPTNFFTLPSNFWSVYATGDMDHVSECNEQIKNMF